MEALNGHGANICFALLSRGKKYNCICFLRIRSYLCQGIKTNSVFSRDNEIIFLSSQGSTLIITR